jgi:hypothetical protein
MGKRELIDVFRADTANLSLFVRVLDVLLAGPKPEDKRYVCRDENGHFTTEQDDVGRSLTRDRPKRARASSSARSRSSRTTHS